MRRVLFFVVMLLLCLPGRSFSETDHYASVRARYPGKSYLIGIGEVRSSGNDIRDRRIAAVMARTELARQIRVRMQEETLDIACEGTAGRIFAGGEECRNEFVMVIQETVDEVIVGSRIVETGEREGIVYAVAVLPRREAGRELDRNFEESVQRTKEHVEKARKGDSESLRNAKEEYLRALTYMKEKEIIEGVKNRAGAAFEDLEKELLKLGSGGGPANE